MGWAGGTELFDGALDVFLSYVPEEEREAAVEKWYEVFSYSDWDTESESEYWVPYLVDILHRRGEIDDEDYALYNE